MVETHRSSFFKRREGGLLGKILVTPGTVLCKALALNIARRHDGSRERGFCTMFNRHQGYRLATLGLPIPVRYDEAERWLVLLRLDTWGAATQGNCGCRMPTNPKFSSQPSIMRGRTVITSYDQAFPTMDTTPTYFVLAHASHGLDLK